MDRPDWSALRSMMNDLEKARSNMADAQRKMLSVRGEARSSDRLIRVVVGPRGQLVDLELDPRVFRNPDSKGLAAAILATVRDAVEDSQSKVRDLRDELIPKDLLAAASNAEHTQAGPDLYSVHDGELGGKNA